MEHEPADSGLRAEQRRGRARGDGPQSRCTHRSGPATPAPHAAGCACRCGSCVARKPHAGKRGPFLTPLRPLLSDPVLGATQTPRHGLARAAAGALSCTHGLCGPSQPQGLEKQGR